MNYYAYGYRCGHLDRYIGIPPLVISLTCPERHLPGYARGYYDGYYHQPYWKGAM